MVHESFNTLRFDSPRHLYWVNSMDPGHHNYLDHLVHPTCLVHSEILLVRVPSSFINSRIWVLVCVKLRSRNSCSNLLSNNSARACSSTMGSLGPSCSSPLVSPIGRWFLIACILNGIGWVLNSMIGRREVLISRIATLLS